MTSLTAVLSPRPLYSLFSIALKNISLLCVGGEGVSFVPHKDYVAPYAIHSGVAAIFTAISKGHKKSQATCVPRSAADGQLTVAGV